MHQTERALVLQEYENGPLQLQEALAKLPAEMWDYKPASNKWSVHEIVVHLADCEVQSHVRIRMIVAEPGTTIVNHDEYQWSVALKYSEQDLEVALAIISMMRRTNVHLLESVPEGTWQNYCIHSKRGRITLQEFLETYAEHIPRHIGQMQRNYREWIIANKL